MLNSKNFELSKTAIKKVLRLVEHVFSIAQPKRKQKFFLLGKANTKKSQVVSNLFLANREARVCAPSGMDSLGQNQWAALWAAHEMVSEKPKSMVLVSLYNSARTYFIKNSWKREVPPLCGGYASAKFSSPIFGFRAPPKNQIRKKKILLSAFCPNGQAEILNKKTSRWYDRGLASY